MRFTIFLGFRIPPLTRVLNERQSLIFTHDFDPGFLTNRTATPQSTKQQ